jgi:hypothetical protein
VRIDPLERYLDRKSIGHRSKDVLINLVGPISERESTGLTGSKMMHRRAGWIALEPDTRVVMKDGPLKGVNGTVLGWDYQWLTVLVATWNGLVPVEVDPGWVSIEEPGEALTELPVH